MWNWTWINSWATSTIGGVLVFSLFIWILQLSIAGLLSASYRRVVRALSDPRHTLPLFAQPPASKIGASGQTAANLRTRNTRLPDEVIRNGGRRGEGDRSQNLFNRFKRRLNLGSTQTIVQESDLVREDYLQGEGMVGLKDKIRDVLTKLQTTSSVGIYGMGGVGKTTLAKAVFKNLKMTGQFEYTCFIQDIKEIVSKHSGQKLTSRLLEDLECQGMKMPKMDRDWFNLQGKTVLLVIDDISSEHQLQEVPWKSGWLGEESRVIITSRNRKLCEGVCKDILNVELLGKDDSRRLFVHHAFEGCNMPAFLSGKGNPMEKILDICGNVPLALEVVGKYLCKQADQQVWISTLQKLKEGEPIDGDLDNRLLTCLRLSYDALADEERNMFLDASILFMGDTLEKIMEIWTSCWGNTVPSSWGNLVFKNMVDSVNGRVWVHEQFRILARNITCAKHKKIQLRTRLALPYECREILTTQSQEPNYAEGLIYRPRATSKFMVLKQDAFCQVNFPELKVLKIKCIDISGENMVLPPKLIFFSWSGAPYAKCPFPMTNLKQLSILELKHWNALEVLPNDLEHCTNLTRLELKGCKKVKELPQGISNFKNLKFLGLKATSVEELPKCFGKLRTLETLELSETNIFQLPSSIEKLKNLRNLGLRRTSLIEFPPSICCLRLLTDLDLTGTSITYLPDAVKNMVGLKELNLSETQLVTLPESIGNLVGLRQLIVGSTALSELPPSIGRLRDLTTLKISSSALQSLPESFGEMGELYKLDLVCDALQSLPASFCNLKKLSYLWITGAKLESLPDSCNQLKALNFLSFYKCGMLHRLPEDFLRLPLEGLSIWGCKRLRFVEQLFGGTCGVPHAWPVECLWMDNYDNTPRHLLSQSGGPTGGRSPRQVKLFPKLRHVFIRDQDSVQRFPENLINTLHQMDTLESLRLYDFDAVTSLPPDFGAFLPSSVSKLQLLRFKSLEELPESTGQITQLQELMLIGCVSLKRLPPSLWALPHLESIDLCGCKSLQMQPSSCILDPLFSATLGERESFTVKISDWMVLLNVVEYFGHISSLRITFFVSRENWVELTGQHLNVGYHQESEWLEGDGIVECLKKMKVMYGDDAMADAAESQETDLLFKLKLWKR